MRKTLLRHLSVSLFCLLMVLSGPAQGGRLLTVGVESIEYMPYYDGKNGKYSGFARDLLDMFAKEHGYEFEYVPRPIRRLYHEFIEARKLDLKFPDKSQWMADMKTTADVQYSDPVCSYVDGILVRKDNLGKGLDHLKTLGFIIGFDPWRHLEALKRDNLRLSPNSNVESMLQMALNHRVDGVYANIAVAQRNLRKMGEQSRMVFDPSLPYRSGDYYLSTIKHPDVLKQFNTFLEKNKPQIDFLKKRYGIASRPQRPH